MSIPIDINPHPIIVHFPIALFISAMGMEILSRIFKAEKLHTTAFHLFVLGTLGASISVATGLYEANDLHLHHPVLDLHRNFAFVTLALTVVALGGFWFIRKNKKQFRTAFLLVLISISAIVGITGYHGGRLVYEYGVGVKE